ncbi:MAG: hypothetical protein P8175_15250 [Deltaproteobacteria bacterium]|jgi:hypothetical protein
MRKIFFLIMAGASGVFLFFFGHVDLAVHTLSPPRPSWAQERSTALEEAQGPNIEWFKKEMKISPKYLEKKEGILGISWPHFITMVFLVIFFIAALIDLYLRNRRTRQILVELMKEGKNESKD